MRVSYLNESLDDPGTEYLPRSIVHSNSSNTIILS
jgi:hypothetical protein